MRAPAPPPSYICRKVAQFHPHVRLAWDGELGTFGILQLLHYSDFKKMLLDRRWRGQGTIYSTTGRPDYLDYDPLLRIPCYLNTIPIEDAYSTTVVGTVRRWARPFFGRVHETAKEQYDADDAKLNAMGREMGKELFKKGQSGGAGAPIIAKKFIKEPQLLKDYREVDGIALPGMPTSPPGGWAKAIENDPGPDFEKPGAG